MFSHHDELFLPAAAEDDDRILQKQLANMSVCHPSNGLSQITGKLTHSLVVATGHGLGCHQIESGSEHNSPATLRMSSPGYNMMTGMEEDPGDIS